jgi:3-methyladenine DNA glycosylase AlkC
MEKSQKIAKKFKCNLCNYITSNKYDYDKHILTRKHQMLIETNEISQERNYDCLCGKKYKHSSSLCKHRKTCSYVQENIDMNDNQMVEYNGNVSNEMFMEFIKQSKETQTFMMEQQRELQNTIIELAKNQSVVNNNNNTTNNNQFNLNVFLNEKCKDALTMTQFIDSLKLSVSDLEETGRLGFVDGISRIFIKGLKELDITMRPLHCTDAKRETVYIKDVDKWEKESNEKTTLKKAIKQIERKNIKLLPAWQEENPDFRILDTNANDEYVKISLSSLGAYEPEQVEKQNDKIIKNVLKEVTIDKSDMKMK